MATAKTEEKKIEEFSWEDKREVFIPKDPTVGNKAVYVAVNGREIMIPRGKRFEVPYPFYERVQIMLDAQEKAEEFNETVPNKG